MHKKEAGRPEENHHTPERAVITSYRGDHTCLLLVLGWHIMYTGRVANKLRLTSLPSFVFLRGAELKLTIRRDYFLFAMLTSHLSEPRATAVAFNYPNTATLQVRVVNQRRQ